MSMIVNMTGGAPALNFKVAGGATAPDNPKENTIWVNTDVPVTGWALSFDAPAAPAEGTVWIVIGTGGYNVFNALRKNTLAISPMAAKQYVGGAWVERDAQIYIGGEWKDLILYMVKNGRTVYPLEAVGKSYDVSNPGAWSGANIVPENGYVSVSGASNGYGIVYVDDIDLTFAGTLTIDGTFSNEYKKCKLFVWSALGTYITDNVVRSIDLPHGAGSVSLDVSGLTGAYVVGISSIATAEQRIADFWLE